MILLIIKDSLLKSGVISGMLQFTPRLKPWALLKKGIVGVPAHADAVVAVFRIVGHRDAVRDFVRHLLQEPGLFGVETPFALAPGAIDHVGSPVRLHLRNGLGPILAFRLGSHLLFELRHKLFGEYFAGHRLPSAKTSLSERQDAQLAVRPVPIAAVRARLL